MAGLSSLVLLAVLARAGREMYGYEIAKAVKAEGEGGLIFKQARSTPFCARSTRWDCSAAGWRPRRSGRPAATTTSPTKAVRPSTTGRAHGRTCAEFVDDALWRAEELCMNIDRPPETVRAYLDALQSALKGASPGLISDALVGCRGASAKRNRLQPEPSRGGGPRLRRRDLRNASRNRRGVRSMEATLTGPLPQIRTNARAPLWILRRDQRSARLWRPDVHAVVAGHRHLLFHLDGHRRVSITAGVPHPHHRHSVCCCSSSAPCAC